MSSEGVDISLPALGFASSVVEHVGIPKEDDDEGRAAAAMSQWR